MKEEKSIFSILKNAKENAKEINKNAVKYKKNDETVLNYDVNNLTVQQRLEIVKFLNEHPNSKESKELINSKINNGLAPFLKPNSNDKDKNNK
ncbi:hypothetical protein [Spiroplasma endosymbiont of Amphibalanus improvisus]|uniref:hypothetical protein n=1 Tax=Spiroplasma endosymbiont of Amphibalanus improvisus TaxID=3066327 RepID=UPI00313E43FA